MGVYEGLTQIKPGMHWQQHQDRHQMLFTAYDPSRDLSPNLPTTSCESNVNLSTSTGAPSRSSSNSGCSTPINPAGSRVSGLCCSFKSDDYDTGAGITSVDYSKMPPSGCQDCGRHPAPAFKGDTYNHHHQRPACKTDASGGSPVDYNNCAASDMYEYKKRDYIQAIEPKRDNPVGSPEEDVLKVCAGCGRQIADRFYLLAVDRRWHASCLQCSQCGRTLDKEATCFAKDGNIYCRKDYQRLFCLNHCTRCKSSIPSTELVMRAREFVYHVSCFFCVVCLAELRKGDHFGMRDGEVYCRLHYELLPPHPSDHNSPVPPPEDYSSPAGYGLVATIGAPPTAAPPGLQQQPPSSLQTALPPSGDFPSSDHRVLSQAQHPLPAISSADGEKVTNSFYNGVSAPRPKGRPRKRKPKDMDSIGSNLDLNSDSYMDLTFSGGSGQHSLSGSNGSHHQRTKRMRTSFKHHQLRTMKTYFTVNHNPDAKDLKQLSQKTGLAKRVLQVWFQNARAKWRRMINKQQENNGTSIKNMDEKSCSDSSSALDSVYHHGPMGLSNHSPQHYLSPASLDCNSS